MLRKTKNKRKYVPAGYKLKVKRSSAGLGLFADEEIPKGICLIEYIGKIISTKEEENLVNKYLFEIDNKITIDGSPRYNTARYINHSCRPNAEAVLKDKRVFIMSKRKIKAGEEINYDYGKEYWNEYIKPLGCRCSKCLKK